MLETFSCELRTTLTNIQHLPKRRCYKITLEVPTDIGARIMEYAAMLGGLRAWDESKTLDGGLVITAKSSLALGKDEAECKCPPRCNECDMATCTCHLAEHGCGECGDDKRVCGCQL